MINESDFLILIFKWVNNSLIYFFLDILCSETPVVLPRLACILGNFCDTMLLVLLLLVILLAFTALIYSCAYSLGLSSSFGLFCIAFRSPLSTSLFPFLVLHMWLLRFQFFSFPLIDF